MAEFHVKANIIYFAVIVMCNNVRPGYRMANAFLFRTARI